MKSWIFIGILITLMSGAAYYYYSSTQTRIEKLTKINATLQDNNDQLVSANDQNIQTIDTLQAAYVNVQQQYEQVQSEFQVIRMQNAELKQRLGDHDIGALAAAKPELVQKVINDASAKALRCFELETGSPFTEAELKAKTSIQANSECPWIFDNLKGSSQ